MIFKFADNSLNTDKHELLRHGEPVPVEPQVFDLIRVLAENAGTLVSKDRLIDEVWAGRIVSEATISARINAARDAVGDNGKDQSIIRTIPRRGFELVASVHTVSVDAHAANSVPHQTIRYAKSTDGTNIAWSNAGEGEPVLLAWHHISHLEKDWTSQLCGPFFHAIAENHELFRYDVRGTGLSDPMNASDTFDHHVTDLQAVAECANLDRFALIAWLPSAAVAIRFAANNPERVSRLILINGYSRGRFNRPNAPEKPEHDPLLSLLKSGGWGNPDNGFMRAWATMIAPSASHDEITGLIELIAHAGTTEDTLHHLQVNDHLDVTEDLQNIQCPTLVIHSRLGIVHPVQEGRRVAAGIPNAEFVELDSANTVYISSDPANEQLLQMMGDFLNRSEG